MPGLFGDASLRGAGSSGRCPPSKRGFREQAVQRRHQRRYSRLGAGLDAVRASSGTGGSTERAVRRARRCRVFRARMLRRSDRDTEHRPDRRARHSLHPVAHDGAVLADAVVPADRPQPHAQQHGVHHRGRGRLPEREWDGLPRERNAPRGPRRAGLEHVHDRQVASVPDGRDEPRLDASQLAGRSRV